MFERSLGGDVRISITPLSIKGVVLSIVRTRAEKDNLLSSGYGLSLCPFIDRSDEKIGKGAVLFLVFRDKELMHASWAFPDAKVPPFDTIFKKVNYGNAGYVGPCYTNPKYRGKGIYPYVLTEICAFLKELGKGRVLINSRIANSASSRGITKAGFKPILDFSYIRLLFWSFYKIKDAKDTVI